MIFYHFIWMKNITSYLASPFYFFLGGIIYIKIFLALAHFFFIQPAFQHGHCLLTICCLCTCLLAFYNYSGRLVCKAHCGFHLIYILPSRAAASKKCPFYICGIYFYIHRIIY